MKPSVSDLRDNADEESEALGSHKGGEKNLQRAEGVMKDKKRGLWSIQEETFWTQQPSEETKRGNLEKRCERRRI